MPPSTRKHKTLQGSTSKHLLATFPESGWIHQAVFPPKKVSLVSHILVKSKKVLCVWLVIAHFCTTEFNAKAPSYFTPLICHSCNYFYLIWRFYSITLAKLQGASKGIGWLSTANTTKMACQQPIYLPSTVFFLLCYLFGNIFQA